LPEQGRNFGNKIWNAFRLVKQWEVSNDIEQPDSAIKAINWFEHKLNEVIETLDKQFAEFRISEAVMTVYTFFWNEFSAWYLEMVKPAYQKPIDTKTYQASIEFFDKILRILHPFMPFITEEIWQLLEDRKEGESIVIAEMPKTESYDKELLENCETVKEVISAIRNIKKEKNIPMRETVALKVKAKNYNSDAHAIIEKLAGVSSIEEVEEKVEGAASFIIKSVEYFVPLGDLINAEEELEKLKKELDYTKGFLNSVMKKLSNERFVQNAPEKVVQTEQKKKAEAEAKIKALEEQIKALSKS
jgi:valyl-tRNA synthetase